MENKVRSVLLVAVVVLSVSFSTAPQSKTSTAVSPKEMAINFKEVVSESGLNYTSIERQYSNGNDGVYVADFNNDGWSDVLVTGGESPTIFENEGGRFQRADALPDINGTVRGALFLDYDNDNWEDLFLFTTDAGAILLENKDGSFERRDSGIGRNLSLPLGATAADYNRDGLTDIFVFQSGDWTDRQPKGYRLPMEKIGTDNGNPNLLLRNTGDGFELITTAGISGNQWSLAASFVDITGDGWPDIHVANDFNHDVVYLNQQNGTFERRRLGEPTDRNGMSSEIAFLGDELIPSIFVTNIYLPIYRQNMSKEKYRVLKLSSFVIQSNRTQGNNLLQYRENGTFVDRGDAFSVQEGGWGWAAIFADFDNDGDQDLFHSTQHLVQVRDVPHFTYPMLWEQTVDGFEKKNASVTGFAETDGRGIAQLDFDRDGDMDVIVAVYGGQYRVYENIGTTGDSLEIRLESKNQPALGARVYIQTDRGAQMRLRNARADYQSQDTCILHFGLNDTAYIEEIRIVWSDGSVQTLEDIRANQILTVTPERLTNRQNFTTNASV